MLKGWNHPGERKAVGKAFIQTLATVCVVTALSFGCAKILDIETVTGKVQTWIQDRKDRKQAEELAEQESGTVQETQLYEEEPVLENTSGFIFPDSDQRYLTREELEEKSDEDLARARNELYARRGRIFNGEKWGTYFGSMDWYEPTIPAESFDDSSVFNEYEKANRDLIVTIENERK